MLVQIWLASTAATPLPSVMAQSLLSFASLVLLLPLASAQLDILAQLAGKKYFGTATDNPELTNTSYVKQLNNVLDFHQLTPANSMKWVMIFSGARKYDKLII